MPVELHERLSEFSYGYGITRECERQLRQQGLPATPFMPNLIHEASLGFDVAFDRPGAPLLLQFKLGQAMRRFSPGPRPTLAQPFWRYKINTAEPDGQFELLLKAEEDGADVFYVAPKFHDWEIYLKYFESGKVIEESLIITPGEIRRTLDDNNVTDGDHKIVYDDSRSYLCSAPLDLANVNSDALAGKVRAHIESLDTPLAQVLENVYEGFNDRSAIRRTDLPDIRDDPDRLIYAIPSDEGRQPRLRSERLGRIIQSGRSREEAIALMVASEAWSSGAQLLFVTQPNKH